MNTKNLEKFSTLIISGGSSGIGNNFIAMFNSINKKALICNLSRTKPVLTLPEEQFFHFSCDLSDSEQLKNSSNQVIQVMKKCSKVGPILLVNNSGFGSYGLFQDLPRELELSMVNLNVRAVVDLTSRFLPFLIKQGGSIVNIASTAAFQPTPTMATYGATKSFVLDWTLALSEELRETGVHCLVVCPGPTGTNFFKRAGFSGPPLPAGMGHTVEFVVQKILRAIEAKKSLVVCGFGNTLLAFVSSKLPKQFVAWLSGKLLRVLRLKLKK